MDVNVKLQGAVGNLEGVKPGETIQLSLPDDATVASVLRELGGRLGDPFPPRDSPPGAKLPGCLRVFVEGELVLQPDRTPLDHGSSPPGVTVVIMASMMGGGR